MNLVSDNSAVICDDQQADDHKKSKDDQERKVKLVPYIKEKGSFLLF